MQGIIYALVPMFAWGSIGFVSNKIGGTPNQQTFGLTLGAFVFAVGTYLFTRPDLDVRLLFFGFLGGILWSIGQNNQFRAMQYMGVSVANPLSSGFQLVLGSLLGALVFQEWTKPIHFILGFTAIVALIAGFYFTSKQDKDKASDLTGQFYDFTRGIRALVFSTLGYVSYTVLFNNIMQFDAITVILPMSLGMMFGAAAFSSFRIEFGPLVLKNGLVGLIWSLGNVFMLLAANTAGLAIAFSFSQLGAIVSVLGGIFILKERKTAKELRWLSMGFLLFVIGAVLLGIIKAN